MGALHGRQREVAFLSDSVRIGYPDHFISERVAGALYFQKNFDFALVFVPLYRRNLPGQPAMAAPGSMKVNA